MKYIITTLEKSQTSSGIEKATATLESADGQILEGVTLWKSSWPNFEALESNTEVDGEYVEKQNGQWLNKNLYPPKEQKPAGKSFGGGVAKAQEKKAEYIKQAQDNKEQSIKVSSTMRDAVLLAIAEYEKDKTNLDTLEQLITKWRTYLWLNFDKEDKDFPAF